MAKRVDQVRMASTASNDGQRIGKRGATAEPLRLNGPETRQKLARASFEKSNPFRIRGRRQTAELDQSRDPQSAFHGRDIKSEIDRAHGSLDWTGVHREFDMIAAFGIERDVLTALSGERARPGAGGEDDLVQALRSSRSRHRSRICPLLCASSRSTQVRWNEAPHDLQPCRQSSGSSRRDRSYGPRPGRRRPRPLREAQAPAWRPLRTSAIPVERRVRST